MSTSDIKVRSQRRLIRKTSIVYLLLAVLMVVINYIYGMFGHGVSSMAMTWMFLYPLAGGALLFLFIDVLTPGIDKIAGYRLFFNCYNSGIATLTLGSFIKGILDVAGTSSPYIVLFYGAGWLFVGVGLMLLLKLAVKHRKNQ
ncbi:MAG: hypothetical protein ACOH15_00700 [Acetobacterium sp.]